MNVDVDTCVIRAADGHERLRLYSMLGEVFEDDRNLFDAVRNGDLTIPFWHPYCMFDGDTIVGNASLCDLRIWRQGSVADVYGVGSVAVPEEFRGNGIARRLMEHLCAIIGQQGRPGVLFTSVPAVYEKHGFRAVPQRYRQVSNIGSLCAEVGGVEVRTIEHLDRNTSLLLRQVRDDSSCRYDGMVMRGDDFEPFWRFMYNDCVDGRYLVCYSTSGMAVAYIRMEYESDRVLISELVFDDANRARALLHAAMARAVAAGREIMSFACAGDHPVWDVLGDMGLVLADESGGRREVFMVRPAAGTAQDDLAGLQWSLADKF